MRESRPNASARGSEGAPAGVRADVAEQWESETDRRLLERVRGGEREARDALARLYDRHAPAMLGVALGILRDRGDAEDLVHDVFIEAWRKAEGFSRERGRVRTWLLVRVRSRAIDRIRSLEVARRHARCEERAGAVGSAPVSEDPAAGPDRHRARVVLASLPEAQRRVLELSFFEGLSCSEIATRCQAPLGTVKSRLLAGMRELRRRFDSAEAPDGA